MSNRTKLRTAEDIIRGGKLPEKTVPICMHADLVAEHEQAERDLQAAARKPSKRLGDDEVRKISERIQVLEAQMRDDTVDFRLRGLSRKAYRELREAHPPRKADDGKTVNERDALLGVNEQTFFIALIRACTYDPQLSDEVWDLLLDEKLTENQFQSLVNTAWGLNEQDVDVPFSHAASSILSSAPE